MMENLNFVVKKKKKPDLEASHHIDGNLSYQLNFEKCYKAWWLLFEVPHLLITKKRLF